ncbi:hypothetical protein [Ensifer canadensis]|uniref:hypothetical protein n=1 Tax=Ensifer canadensis TaxID=555315 RepID=UPI0035E3DDF4
MKKLEHSKVYRGGITSDVVRLELGATPSVQTYVSTTDAENIRGIQIIVNIASKGGGTTTIVTKINRTDFDELAAHMLRADKDVACKAFARALLKVK